MDTVIAIIIGLCLAASCGFRVFVPLLAAGAAIKAGYIVPAEGFEWLGTWPAIVALAIATVAEIGAYYVPWLDHALDTIASPAAVLAGTLLFAASAVTLDPFWQWSLAIIAGGGAAATVQGGTVAARIASTSSSGGLTNFIVATIENVTGIALSILSIFLPLFALALLVLLTFALYYVGRAIACRFWRRRPRKSAA